MEQKPYDIFISYKESDGKFIAKDLSRVLKETGYTAVYFNELERRNGNFLSRLELAINKCRDFILILTPNVKKDLLDRKNFEKDYVLWEIQEAYKKGKNILIFTVNNTYFEKTDKLKVEESISDIVNHETFSNIEDIISNLTCDISSRMDLYSTIFNVATSFCNLKSQKEESKALVKHGIFTRGALAALCEFITDDNTIATALENCKTIDELNRYISSSNLDIFASFNEYFEFTNDSNNMICVNIKKDKHPPHRGYGTKTTLQKLFYSYCIKDNAFHHSIPQSPAKRELNTTISTYILIIAHNNYYINSRGEKSFLIDEIIPTLIKTNNYKDDYLTALVEKQHFAENKYLICDTNDSNDTIFINKIKNIFGEYYLNLYENQSLVVCYFSNILFRWIESTNPNDYTFHMELIDKYKCCDAKVWNTLQNLRGYHFKNILIGRFREYILTKNYHIVLSMIKQSLNIKIWWTNDTESNEKFLNLIYSVLEKILSDSPPLHSKTYKTAILRVLNDVWHKLNDDKYDNFKRKIKLLASQYSHDDDIKKIFKVVSADDSYYTFNDKKEYILLLEEFLNTSIDNTNDVALYFHALQHIKVNGDIKSTYDKCCLKALQFSANNNFYGLKTIVFFRDKWLSLETQKSKYCLINDFLNNDIINLENWTFDQIKSLIKSVNSNQTINHENLIIKLFVNIIMQKGSHKKSFEAIGMLINNYEDFIIEYILQGDNECSQSLEKLLTLKSHNDIKIYDWECACIFSFISKLLNENVFFHLNDNLKNSIIHFVKTRTEYSYWLQLLLENEQWENLNNVIKTAFILHIDKIVDDYHKYPMAIAYIKQIINDYNCYKYSYAKFKKIYGIREETLIYHIISLYRYEPLKLAKTCAITLVKIYNQSFFYNTSDCEKNTDNLNKENLFEARKNLFDIVISNPCIRSLSKYIAKAMYSNNIDEPDLFKFNDSRENKITDSLKNIIKNDIYPPWFNLTVTCSNINDIIILENVNVNKIIGIDRYRELEDSSFADIDIHIKDIIKNEKDVDLDAGILLWQDSLDDEETLILSGKKFIFRLIGKFKNFELPQIKAKLFLPNDSCIVECENTTISAPKNISTLIENIKLCVKNKYHDQLITNTWKYDKVKPYIKINSYEKETINSFFYFYEKYGSNQIVAQENSDAYVRYLNYIKKTLKLNL